ncbi:MAG: UbiD family decarboxylase, partial [Candidatus Thermoplasmatota archaeon]|nr:UbiD family decarboxylase [Candidatus Thermoplasmatota archaeon]MCL5987481.1 UbiD family decarboxylase [Candidatus Thermoplasmatota archaeon]
MTYEDLHEFLDDRKRKNDFLEIETPVERDLELTWILSEEERIGDKRTMLFSNVKGSEIPVAGNLFSTEGKMHDILGGDPGQIGNDLVNLIRPPRESGSMLLKGMEMLKELSGLRPKIHEKLPSTHRVLDSVDLTRYPICKTWPEDA